MISFPDLVGVETLQVNECHTVPYRTVPYRAVPCRTVPCRTVPYHTIDPSPKRQLTEGGGGVVITQTITTYAFYMEYLKPFVHQCSKL